MEETNADGTKNLVYRKRFTQSVSCDENAQDTQGVVYPEIVWNLISKHLKPEQIGSFAGINRVCYALTKRESFWRTLYQRHCQYNSKLPARLRIEDSCKLYGLQQRVIRALYHTYKVFTKNVSIEARQDSQLHLLVKRRCVNVWYHKGMSDWKVYFKFKKSNPYRKNRPSEQADFIEEWGRIEANPEEDSQVLQVSTEFFEVTAILVALFEIQFEGGLRELQQDLGV